MKKLFCIVIAIAMVVGMAACSSGETVTETASTADETTVTASDETTATASDETAEGVKYTVGFIPETLAAEYWAIVEQGMESIKDELGVELIVKDPKGDVAAQVSAIEDLITMGVDAIAIYPIDVVAVEPACAEAVEAGIAVISWASYIEGSTGYFALDQYQCGYTVGKIAGQWIIDNLESDTEAYVLTMTNTTLPAFVEREEGMVEGLLSIAPNANIVDRLDATTTEEAISMTENVLTKSPELNVVLGHSEQSSLGAYQAMDAAGKKQGEACVVGPDATDEILKLIKDNTIFVGTCDIEMNTHGIITLEYIVKILEEGPQDTLYTDITPVTIDNIDDYYTE